MTEASLTLFIPCLFGLAQLLRQFPAKDIPRLPSLELLLSRANVIKEDVVDTPTRLGELFGMPKLPVAALRYHFAHRNITEAEQSLWFMCADPVYIQPDRDSAVLVAHGQLKLTHEEAQAMAESINAHFIDEPWEIEALTAQQWILKCHQEYELTTHALSTAMGQHIHDYLPVGKDKAYWQRTVNEIQMLLYNHPVNQQREAEGRIPVNSLWCWGEGCLPENKTVNWQVLIGEDDLLPALARYFDCACYNKPDLVNCKGNTLYYNSEFIAAERDSNFTDWVEMIKKLDDEHISPAIDLLKSNQLDTIILLTSNGWRYELDKNSIRRWWRMRKSLAYYTNRYS